MLCIFEYSEFISTNFKYIFKYIRNYKSIMSYKNLTIIGTSHIAKESLKEVEETIEKENPDIVALELDKKRYFALTSKIKRGRPNIFKVGIGGYFFGLLGAWAERKLGEIVKIEPGSEMRLAIRLAKKKKLKLAFIDQDIELTLARISKSLSWKEKWNFLVDIFRGFVLRKKEIEFDLTRVPEQKIIDALIKKVKERYPNLYKVLITERNNVMAANLSSLIYQYPDKKILAIVGAGHEKDILELLKKPRISYSFSIS